MFYLAATKSNDVTTVLPHHGILLVIAAVLFVLSRITRR